MSLSSSSTSTTTSLTQTLLPTECELRLTQLFIWLCFDCLISPAISLLLSKLSTSKLSAFHSHCIKTFYQQTVSLSLHSDCIRIFYLQTVNLSLHSDCIKTFYQQSVSLSLHSHCIRIFCLQTVSLSLHSLCIVWGFSLQRVDCVSCYHETCHSNSLSVCWLLQ